MSYKNAFRNLVLLIISILPATLLSQTGHPAKGSWSGELIPFTYSKSERIHLLIDSWNGELKGKINPGRQGVTMKSVVLDADSWTLTIAAETSEGRMLMIGKLTNLGSWTSRKYQGTYTRGDETGLFNITLN